MPDSSMPFDDEAPENAGETDLKALLPTLLIGLGAVSLLRTSRLLSLAVAGAWLYDVANTTDRGRRAKGRNLAARRAVARRIDNEAEDSFPASDPPSFSGSTAGAP